ncbi:MAG: peptidoglycan-associated lipoprotein Pal [Candidatus Sumerlaeia bacterium]
MRTTRLLTMAVLLSATVAGLTACRAKKPKEQPSFLSNGRATTEDVYPVPPVDAQNAPGTATTISGPVADIAEQRLPEGLTEGYVEEALPVIYFDFDSFELKASEMEKLDRLVVPYVKANPTAHIQIEGHCDERGTEEYNMNLGQKRASAVREYLIGKGCNEANLHTISYGEERPVDPGQTEEAYAKNRRVQFLVYFTE